MRPLVWFRRDLRVRDNAALSEACRIADDGVVAVFVVSPGEWADHDDAPVKVDFWLRNLRALGPELAKLNIPLRIVECASAGEIPGAIAALADDCSCDALYYNHEYEVDERRRDERTVERLARDGGNSHGFHDHVVFDPDEIRTKTGGFYSVFSPFKRTFIAIAEERGVECAGLPPKQIQIEIESSSIPRAVDGFESSIDPSLWPAGERAAHTRLERFIEDRIEAYKDERDFPAIEATSVLSPYLNSGVISARRCLSAAREANGGRFDAKSGGSKGPGHWISEVIWREFYQHVLVGYPRVSMGRAFRPETDRIRWNDDREMLDRWKEGRTGVPLVDAAMRQLASTGWMHNRLRMVSAMYLTKDLFVDWREGERHFMRNLIDGDLGSNNGGWQWSASTGTDAAPYFRIFNPVRQSKRFDPQGEFIRRWVPELADVEGDSIHDPSEIPSLLRSGLEYPDPMVDHRKARDRVMEAFDAIKQA